MYEIESYIFNFVMVIAAAWIVNRFWGSFFEKKKTSFLSIVAWILYCVFQMILQCNKGSINLIITCLNIMSILLIAIFGYNCKGKKKYFLLPVFCSVWSLLEEFVFFLISGVGSSQESLDVIGVVISNILMMIFVYIVSMIRNEKSGDIIPNNFYLFLLLIPVGSIYIAISEFYSKNDRIFIMITISVLLLFNVVIFEIYIKMNEMFLYEKEKTVYAQQLNIISSNTAEQERIMEEFHEEKHNLVNELIVLKGSIENDDKDIVIKNLNKIINNCCNMETVSSSGNSTVDAIINFKYAIAREYGIDFHLKIYIPSELSIEQCDIGVVLGNAIDNAIEAVRECKNKEKVIDISMGVKKEACIIVIKNLYENKIKRDKNGRILSTKKEKYRHGYGLKSIEKIAEEYQGEAIVNFKDNIFSLTVVLNLGEF